MARHVGRWEEIGGQRNERQNHVGQVPDSEHEPLASGAELHTVELRLQRLGLTRIRSGSQRYVERPAELDVVERHAGYSEAHGGIARRKYELIASDLGLDREQHVTAGEQSVVRVS